MSQFDNPEELPLGLVMQLGQDLDAMSSFSNLGEADKMQMVQYIKSASTGDEAKVRIEEVLNKLHNHENFF